MSAVPAAAFIGAVVTVMAVYLIAVKNGASKITLVLAGVAVSNLLGAGIDTITTFFPDSLNGITDFKIGGVIGISLSKLYPAWIYIAVGIAAALLLSGELDILSLGDKTAKSLGLNVRASRLALLMAAALLAGAAVSFAGLISFIGLIIRISRGILLKRKQKAYFGFLTSWGVLPLVLRRAFEGIFAPYEIQLGIVVSYIGVPFFIYLIMKKRGGRHGDRA